MKSVTKYVGNKSITTVKHILNLFAFAYRLLEIFILRPVPGRALSKKAEIEQIYFTAVQALPIIVPIALMVGTGLIIQVSKLSGELELEKITAVLIIRELGPIITALLVILRSATAVTIEISCMVVFNEIETIEMAGADPMKLLAFPRFVGITTAVVCLFIIFNVVAIFGGYAIVWITTDLNISSFLLLMGKAITPTDLIVGILKAFSFSISITIISLYHGFKTPKVFTFIPISASKSAVECFFWCMVINIFISAVFYL